MLSSIISIEPVYKLRSHINAHQLVPLHSFHTLCQHLFRRRFFSQSPAFNAPFIVEPLSSEFETSRELYPADSFIQVTA